MPTAQKHMPDTEHPGGWPAGRGARETVQRVRIALIERRKTMRDVHAEAQSYLPRGVTLAYQTVSKALHGGCREGEKGKAVRRALARLTRMPQAHFFDPVDAELTASE